jgi:hypothetical protein
MGHCDIGGNVDADGLAKRTFVEISSQQLLHPRQRAIGHPGQSAVDRHTVLVELNPPCRGHSLGFLNDLLILRRTSAL